VPVPVTPGIHITAYPPLGTGGYASGTVGGVSLADYQGVAVYIKVAGGWWTKPTFDFPLTMLQSDGSWSANIATGGDDVDASEIRAYLIPNGFTVPQAAGSTSLPDSLSGLLYNSVVR
jgi:hypothetical protein